MRVINRVLPLKVYVIVFSIIGSIGVAMAIYFAIKCTINRKKKRKVSVDSTQLPESNLNNSSVPNSPCKNIIELTKSPEMLQSYK